MFTRKLERVAAVLVALGSIGFIAVFTHLKAVFGYPDVLDLGAAEVLPRLRAGGEGLRVVWLIYAALPLTLIAGGIGSMPLLEDGGGRGLARLGAAAAALAGVTMLIGLARWPSIHWTLAAKWASASAEQRETYAVLFDATNRYLGNLLGELLGELALAGWLACIGTALRRSDRRAAGVVLLGAAALIGIGALRQLTTLVDPIATLANAVLPIALVMSSVMLWQHARPYGENPHGLQLQK
jgi:Domain of unknown function (DUF4386)